MSQPAEHHLPDLLARIVKAAGEDAALLLAKEFGGRPFYVPLARELRAGHRLVELVGLKRAEAICDELGRGEIILPRGPFSSVGERKRAVAELLKQGRSQPSIALATNLHIRTVEKIAAKLQAQTTDKKQGRLI